VKAWDWQAAAACRDMELILFFGYEGERGAEKAIRERDAVAVCEGCGVRPECLEYALGRPERYGTYGGMTEDERWAQRRREGRARVAAERRDARRRERVAS
jgi:WhiB family redox-sensing transcriptional regulator